MIEEGAAYYNWRDQPLQLYNIRRDPSETRNQAAARPEVVAKLRKRLAERRPEARQGELVERIPGYPPVVYGADENARHGDSLRDRVAKVAERDVTKRQR